MTEHDVGLNQPFEKHHDSDDVEYERHRQQHASKPHISPLQNRHCAGGFDCCHPMPLRPARKGRALWYRADFQERKFIRFKDGRGFLPGTTVFLTRLPEGSGLATGGNGVFSGARTEPWAYVTCKANRLLMLTRVHQNQEHAIRPNVAVDARVGTRVPKVRNRRPECPVPSKTCTAREAMHRS